MEETIPIFTSHYSLGDSILTLDKVGNTKPENPSSIFDLAGGAGLKELFLVDNRFDGFVEAYKNSCELDIQLNFGIKLVCCHDHDIKDDDSRDTESKVIIFAKNTQGYHDLIKIYNRAWTENFYYQGRTSWKQLKELWTKNLVFALPFYSSFLAVNTMTTKNIIPNFPVKKEEVVIFAEQNSGLPFEDLIKQAIKKFFNSRKQVVKTKSIYYNTYEDFIPYMVYRCIHNKTKFEKPNINHLSSNKFCWEDYLKIC